MCLYILCSPVTYSSTTHNTNIHVLGEIRTRNPSTLSVADSRLHCSATGRNRACDLPACSAMPQPISLPHTRHPSTLCSSIFFRASRYRFLLGSALIWSSLHGQMPFAILWSKHTVFHLISLWYYSQHSNCFPSSLDLYITKKISYDSSVNTVKEFIFQVGTKICLFFSALWSVHAIQPAS